MSVTFEIDRFEWADDRLELEGRWYGLRGRRFIRPTLDVEVDGESRRLLALMEHKPWAALDGEDWLAAFQWEGEPAKIAAEVTVGPDLTFELPQPGGGTPGKASPRRLAAAAASAVQPARRRDEGLERRVEDAERERSEAVAEARTLRRALEQKERTVRELQERLAAERDDEVTRVRPPEVSPDRVRELEAQAARVPELQAQAARVPLLEDELTRVRAELEAAQAASGAAEDVQTQLAELQRRVGAAVAARDAAREQAEQVKRERYEAQGALAAAERELQRAVAERDDLRASASAERRELRRERDVAMTERDAAIARLEEARQARDHAQLAHDAVRAERPRVDGVAEVVRKRGVRGLPWIGRLERSHDEMLALRFAALVALSVVCLLVAIWILLAA